MFYGREAPDAPLYVEAGQHFDAGEPLYIVEVMKMFNGGGTPAGTIDEVLVEVTGSSSLKGSPCSKSPPTRRLRCCPTTS